MEKSFLEKIRKLNWVLSESTTGNLSYSDLTRILCEIIDANVYVIDSKGYVLGAAYKDANDTSTFEDELGAEKISESDNMSFLDIKETEKNLIGNQLVSLFGINYGMKEKYHMIIPCICSGGRLGTILLARYNVSFTDEEVALCEYGATVVALEIQRNIHLQRAKERSLKMAVDIAMDTLSYSEKDALEKILQELDGDEGQIVASKIAAKYGLTNSVIVNALKKLDGAGILKTKSLGMKGMRIKIINPYLK